ncbi:MAG TPA: NAD(P)-dependent alcohol dehydrogenase [Bradyrhizobium sp.]|nr:NAD(P)-dependent alcohol dehydrogenase [Bradyrhizobium sp.]
MKALAYDRFGGLDVLHFAELEEPRVGPGLVLVSLRASSVNVIDNRVRAGKMGLLAGKRFPRIPGADVAGVVVETGTSVAGLKVGDSVFGALDPFKGGAFAERAAMPANQLALKPPELAFETAAALPLAGLAALTSIRDLGKVGRRVKVLIHGASGAVGLFAVQIARRLGAEVTAVAGTAGIEAAKAAGADIVVDYRKQDASHFPVSFDVILNASGALPYAQAKASLAGGGRFIEPSPTIPGVIGATILNVFRHRQHLPLMTKVRRADLELLATWAMEGSLKPLIAKNYPFADAPEALRAMEQGGVVGKVVVSMGGA